jgi:HD-GYP domain-containing protein (c-di-GMP phosphodiesterase class II)
MLTSDTKFLESIFKRTTKIQGLAKQLHAERVAQVSAQLGQLTGLEENEIRHLYLGALLHDIGKEFISNAVVEKVNPLTRAEFYQIQCHPLLGYIYLRQHTSNNVILNIVLYHHERLNGTGYPYGLKINKIPLESKICAVVDVWDALISNRCYHKAWDATRVLEYIWMRAGTQFDPDVVLLFLKIIESQEITNRPNIQVHLPHTMSKYSPFAKAIN